MAYEIGTKINWSGIRDNVLVKSECVGLASCVMQSGGDEDGVINGELFLSRDGYLYFLSNELDGQAPDEGCGKYMFGWWLCNQEDFSNKRFEMGHQKKISNEEIVDGYVQVSANGQRVIESKDGGDVVKGYHTKCPLIFHRKAKEPLRRTDFFGVEIEYNFLGNYSPFIDYASTHQGFFHYERDGSLDYGVECISQPFSELYYHNRGKKQIAELVRMVPNEVEAEDYDGDDIGMQKTTGKDTGIHIHISRASLSDEVVCKLFYFINEASWRDSIISIAGRNPNTYCERKENNKKKKVTECELENQGRYVSVNLTNDATVEIRIFKSSSVQWKVLARIEFVMCLINYLRLSTGRYWNNISFEKFVEFVRLYKGSYENLWELLEVNQLTTTSIK